MKESKEFSGAVAGASLLLIIVMALLMMIFASCEKPKGCGIVRGGYSSVISGNEVYYLRIQFEDSSKTRDVQVDQKTFLDFKIGSEICF